MQLQDTIEREIIRVNTQAHAAAGQEFNLASPEQVAHVLYDVCKVKAKSGSETIKFQSTSVEFLQAVEKEHPLVPLLLDFRSLSKVRSTYDWRNYLYVPKVMSSTALGLPENCQATNTTTMSMSAKSHGRVHSKWNQQQTRTGRLSSSEPNQQQVPNTKEITRNCSINVRRLFKAPQGCCLVSADYAQIEMRVLAHYCNDKNMQDLFRSTTGGAIASDIYSLMASRVFNKELKSVSKDDRARVKQVALGIIYGMGPELVARKLNIPLAEAKRCIFLFFQLYPGVQEWIKKVKGNARRDGYVTSLLGHRRFLPDISSADAQLRAKAERSAVNSVIQGSASDILKLAMLHVDYEIQRWEGQIRENHPTFRVQRIQPPLPRLIMSIHDEVIFEVSDAHTSSFVMLLSDVLEKQIPQRYGIRVPLTIKVESGPSWGELLPITSATSPPPPQSNVPAPAPAPASAPAPALVTHQESTHATQLYRSTTTNEFDQSFMYSPHGNNSGNNSPRSGSTGAISDLTAPTPSSPDPMPGPGPVARPGGSQGSTGISRSRSAD